MEQSLVSYFQGEKYGALGFGLAGVVAVIVSLAVLRTAPHYRPILYPLLLVGALQLGVSGVLLVRTDSRVARLAEQLRARPAEFQKVELTRMAGLRVAFRAIETVEILMVITGIGLCFLLAHRQAAFAVGLGLILQGAAMLTLDLAAERRAHTYTDALTAMAPPPS